MESFGFHRGKSNDWIYLFSILVFLSRLDLIFSVMSIWESL